MTNLQENVYLNWQDFQQNIASSYKDLQKNCDFSDVTLVCEEDRTIEAHRIVLHVIKKYPQILQQRKIQRQIAKDLQK